MIVRERDGGPGPTTYKEQIPVNESTAHPPYDWGHDVPAHDTGVEVAGTLDLLDTSSMSVGQHAEECARLAHALTQELQWLILNTPEDEDLVSRLDLAQIDMDRTNRMLRLLRSAAEAEQRS